MFEIPWTEKTIPHVMLEVNQECNITCATCYKKFNGTSKSLAEIRGELDVMQRHTRLHTVSIGGGEPTMHPQIIEIVGECHDRGLKTALITNGLLVDAPLLHRLKGAGLDMIMFHIDPMQSRPDLPKRPTDADLRRLRDEKVDAAGAAGIDTGLSFMLSRQTLDELVPLIRYVIEKPEISYLLVTHALAIDWAISASSLVRKDRKAGAAGLASNRRYQQRTTNDEVYELLERELGIVPFGYMPAKAVNGKTANRLQWINYFVPVAYGADAPRVHRTTAGKADLWMLKLYKALSGRYIFYTRPDRGLMLIQLFLNGLFSGHVRETLRFLLRAQLEGERLRGKRLAFDQGHHISANGELVCVEHCPNPTVRDGKIVPVCLADHEACG